LKGSLEVWFLSLWELCEGNLEGGLPSGDPEGYGEKALETDISFHRGPVWGTWRRAHLRGDFGRRLKGTLGMGLLSFKRLRGGGLGGSSFPGDPGRYVQIVSGYGHLSSGNLRLGRGRLVYRGL